MGRLLSRASCLREWLSGLLFSVSTQARMPLFTDPLVRMMALANFVRCVKAHTWYRGARPPAALADKRIISQVNGASGVPFCYRMRARVRVFRGPAL